MPQVTNLTLPVGDAGANVTFKQIDIQDGLATWREDDSTKSFRALGRITAQLKRPAGQQRNYIANVRMSLPRLRTVDGVETISHTDHVEFKVTTSPNSTADEAANSALCAKEVISASLIQQVLSELAGLY